MVSIRSNLDDRPSAAVDTYEAFAKFREDVKAGRYDFIGQPVDPDVQVRLVADPLPLQGIPADAQTSPVEKIRNLRDIQGQHGNWNSSPYMRGLYNGLELALAVLENERQPAYLEQPERYLEDRTDGAANAPSVAVEPRSHAAEGAQHQTAPQAPNGPREFIVEHQVHLDVKPLCACIGGNACGHGLC